MRASDPLPYVPLSIRPVLSLSRLPLPRGSTTTHIQFSAGIPPFRLNLLAADGARLYLAHSSTHLAVYAIARSRGVQLIPLATPQIRPATTINNVRVAHLPDGSDTLLLSGGHERDAGWGSVTVLPLPRAEDASWDDDTVFGTRAVARTVYLPLRSAWGLAVHEPTGRVAVSANTRRIAVLPVAALLAGEVDAVERLRWVPDAHIGNIPCVAFSPCGRWLASASIDTTFALYDVVGDAGAAAAPLLRSGWPLETSAAGTGVFEQRCWCVHWFGARMVIPVPLKDKVWKQCERNRTRRLVNPEDWYEAPGAEQQSIFSDEIGPDRGWGRSRAQGVVMYDDGPEFEESDGQGPLQHMVCSELREHEVYQEHQQALSALQDARRDSVKAQVGSSEEGKSENYGFQVKSSCDLKPHDSTRRASKNGKQKQESLLFVGRHRRLSLFRVRRKVHETGKEDRKVELEELDSVELQVRARTFTWCTDAEEISALNVLVLSVKGVGVVLLRVICAPGDGDKEHAPRLFIERVFSRHSELFAGMLPWERAMYHVIGTAVVHRGRPGAPEYGAELWILWQDAMVECWELSRGRKLLDEATTFV